MADTSQQSPYVGFAKLHLHFADRVADVLGMSKREALRSWTPAYRLAGSAWARGGEPNARTLASAYAEQLALETERPSVGCFSYELEDAGQTLRLHFKSVRRSGALRPSQRAQRRGELLGVLSHAQAACPAVRLLRGGSWLYNLPGYRALFPPAVLTTAVPADPRDELEFMALWGQFLRGDGTLYEPTARTFQDRLTAAHDEHGLLAAFPLPKLEWLAPVTQINTWLSREIGA